MWNDTSVTRKLNIKYPIIQAPMAGAGITSPQLIAAVSNAGGLGVLGAGYMTPDEMHRSIHQIRELTSRPFGVNLLLVQPASIASGVVSKMNAHLGKYREKLGLPSAAAVATYSDAFDQQLKVIVEENVPVFSFAFGIPSRDVINQLKNKGLTIMGTATTVKEALLLEEHGADMIVAQGSEAGGHRGTFAGPFEEAMIGLFSLLPQIADQVRIPVIAAGGIMDARTVIASFVLGAEGVQMGTAFLTSKESGAHPNQKQAMLSNTDRSTVVTPVVTGRPARFIKTDFIEEMQQYPHEVPMYPVQNALTKELRSAAITSNNKECMALMAGQSLKLCKDSSAAEIIQEIVVNIPEILSKINGSS